MIEKLELVFEKYNIPDCLSDLECDGSTTVISQILQFENIDHRVCMGALIWDKTFLPHFWIDIPGSVRIDFKARMWAGDEAPHGFFYPDDWKEYYAKHSANLPDYNPALAYYLAGIRLEGKA